MLKAMQLLVYALRGLSAHLKRAALGDLSMSLLCARRDYCRYLLLLWFMHLVEAPLGLCRGKLEGLSHWFFLSLPCHRQGIAEGIYRKHVMLPYLSAKGAAHKAAGGS